MATTLAAAPMDDLPAHERVYRDLRSRILHGELAPGQAVTLRGVAGASGVSTTPAREAVGRLVAERALEETATGRARAPVASPATLAELTAARALLEPELAARALPRSGPALLTALARADAAVEDALRAGDAAAYVRANTAFHRTLYEAAEAPALLALVESVWLQLNPTMRMLTGRAGTGGLTDHHAEAMAALAARDEGRLRAAIRADAEQAGRLIAAAPLTEAPRRGRKT
jgi:DNA-binding GntR family transcriptional regulator